MLVELVAKPIPKTRAAGLPINSATKDSSSLWMSRVPTCAKERVILILELTKYFHYRITHTDKELLVCAHANFGCFQAH